MPYSHFKWDIPTSQATDKTEKKEQCRKCSKIYEQNAKILILTLNFVYDRILMSNVIYPYNFRVLFRVPYYRCERRVVKGKIQFLQILLFGHK